jgi:hypothetical protein
VQNFIQVLRLLNRVTALRNLVVLLLLSDLLVLSNVLIVLSRSEDGWDETLPISQKVRSTSLAGLREALFLPRHPDKQSAYIDKSIALFSIILLVFCRLF